MPPPAGAPPPPPLLPPLTPDELEAAEDVGEVADTEAAAVGFGLSRSLARGSFKEQNGFP